MHVRNVWKAAPLLLMISCQPSGNQDLTERDGAPSAGPVVEAEAPIPVDTVEVQVSLADAGCVPGECVCRGSASPSAGLAQLGVDLSLLAEGDRCLAADLDGNDVPDFVLMGGEGLLAVIRRGPDGPLAVVEVDAGGLPELYEPRGEEGTHGEPPSDVYGIFVPWVGQNHAVFLWDGDGFRRTLLPAWVL